MAAEQIDIFNKETRPISFADGNEAKLQTKQANWFFAMILASLFKLINVLRVSPISPIVTAANVTDAVTTLRDSTTGGRVRVYNEGPDTIFLTFGETPPVSSATPPVVATNIVRALEYIDSPCAVLGKVRAVTLTGGNAAVTTTVFC